MKGIKYRNAKTAKMTAFALIVNMLRSGHTLTGKYYSTDSLLAFTSACA